LKLEFQIAQAQAGASEQAALRRLSALVPMNDAAQEETRHDLDLIQ
jgi:hypothetical protein